MNSVGPHEPLPVGAAAPNQWLWALFTLGVAWGISLMLIHVPAELKRLVLFYCGYGLAVGMLSGLIWQWLGGYYWPRWAVGYVGALAAIGLLQVAIVSYGEFREACLKSARSPQTVLALQMLETDVGADGVPSRRLRDLRALGKPSFTFYLQHRVRQLGQWSETAAWLMWITELVLATLLAGTVFRYVVAATARNAAGTKPAESAVR